MLLYAFLRVLVERDFFITLNNFCHAFQESFSLSHFDSTLINVLDKLDAVLINDVSKARVSISWEIFHQF